MKLPILILTFLSLILNVRGQVQNTPINFNISQEIAIHSKNTEQYFHSSIKPHNKQFIPKIIDKYTFLDTGKYYYDFTVKLFQKHLLEIHEGDVHIGMDVLLDVYFGKASSSEFRGPGHKRVSTNSRGFRIAGDIGRKVSFETRFYENQMFYASFLDSIAFKNGFAYGLGRTKAFKTWGYDVGNSMGYVSFKASKQINIQFGHDKIFIGNGYRSLLVSDNSSNYPLLKIQAESKNKKWNYLNVNAWLQSLKRSSTLISTEALFKRKNGSFRYISFKPSKKIEIGLFEGTMYKTYYDSIGLDKPSFDFYVPIIGLSNIKSRLTQTNNSVFGLNTSLSLKQFILFGQLAVDNEDYVSYQIGGKWLEPFGLKRNWIHLEWNSVPNYMYTSSSEEILQNYTHLNQPLAHPLGASFNEITLIYYGELNRAFIQPQINLTTRVRYGDSGFGENILLSNDSDLISTFDEEEISTLYFKLEAGYNFNIKTRLQLFGGIYVRRLKNHTFEEKNQTDNYFTVGIRCNLNNYYLDL